MSASSLSSSCKLPPDNSTTERLAKDSRCLKSQARYFDTLTEKSVARRDTTAVGGTSVPPSIWPFVVLEKQARGEPARLLGPAANMDRVLTFQVELHRWVCKLDDGASGVWFAKHWEAGHGSTRWH